MDVLKESLRCMRCGLCQSVCPVFRETRLESSVARGKVNLIRAVENGNQRLTARLEEIAYQCLSCQACSSSCPSGVRADELVLETRARISEDRKQPLLRNLVLKSALTSVGKTELLASFTRFYQTAGLKSMSRLFLSEDLSKKQRILPKVSGKFLRAVLPEVTKPVGNRIGRLGYFLGCATNVIYPSVGKTTVALLAKAGYEVVTPRSVACCGMPHRAYGDMQTLHSLVEQNTGAFEKAGVDAIVTDCATCGKMLKQYSGFLGRESLPVYDISEFLTKESVSAAVEFSGTKTRVTYHDACHLSRGQGITEAPRDLLRSLDWVDFVEMADPSACCGGAGSFSLLHYDLSMKILSRKIANIQETGARIVATGCPSCRVQLEHGLRLAKSDIKVVHPVELLA